MSDENDKVEHHPAPWYVCFDHPSDDCRDRIGYIRTGAGRWDNEISMSCCCDPGTQQRASLYVAGAAPEMLEVLEYAARILQAGGEIVPGGWFEKAAQEAIAKARNEVTS